MGKRKHDIERYLRGEMTAAEMYALEKEALRDPFLAEAMEGADQAGSEPFLFDLQELNATLHQRTRGRRPKTISFWGWSMGIAAGLALLALSSVFVISLINKKQQGPALAVAEKTEPKLEEQRAMADSAAPAPTQQATPQVHEQVRPTQNTRRHSNSDLLTETDDTNQQATRARLESVAQEAEPVHGDERIVEADLTEVPSELQPQARTGNAAPRPAARLIQGKVSSTEDGAALQGVNVLVKGTSIGTITDAEGNYQIALNDPTQTLMFSFIGLKDIEVSPAGKKELNVEMSPDLAQLSEVVVSGYDANAGGNHATLRLAEPKGGRNAFQKYLKEKMNYPEQALENKVEGGVTVQFTVDANGQLGEFKIIKGIGYGCDDEVIRLIKEGPAWAPSQRNNQPVKEKVKVRLMFDIPN
jgi:TonB family protein